MWLTIQLFHLLKEIESADVTSVMKKVVDSAVIKAYGSQRKISWMEIFAGKKSTKIYGDDVWLPDETLAPAQKYVVSIKGTLTTAGGFVLLMLRYVSS